MHGAYFIAAAVVFGTLLIAGITFGTEGMSDSMDRDAGSPGVILLVGLGLAAFVVASRWWVPIHGW